MIYELDPEATVGDLYLLVGLTLIPLLALCPFWFYALNRPVLPIYSLPVQYAQFFVRVTPPVYTLAALLYAALDFKTAAHKMDNSSIFIHVAGAFFILATNVGVTMGFYFLTVANLYVVKGSTAWWKMIRLEALIAGILLLLVGVAFLVGGIDLSVEGMPGWGMKFLNRLSLGIDVVQLAASLYSFCAIIYVIWRLKKENDILRQGMGKIPLKVLACSVVWIARCSYDVAFAIIAVQSGQVYEEPANLVIPTRMIDFSLPPAMLAMLTIVVRDDVWHDRILRPETAPPQSPKAWFSDIAHGIANTLRGYLAVLTGKKTDQPADTPAAQQPEIPLGDMANDDDDMANDSWNPDAFPVGYGSNGRQRIGL